MSGMAAHSDHYSQQPNPVNHYSQQPDPVDHYSQQPDPVETHVPQSAPMMGGWQGSTPSQPRRTLYEKWVEEWWLVELLAVLASCGLTLALCLIVWAFDDKQAWDSGSLFHGTITLGTVVALLATLSVASAVHTVMECLSHLKWLWYSYESRPLADMDSYDSASRGSMGSFWLLCKLRVTASPVASLGAFLMILQLAIAPLAQQSIEIFPIQAPDVNGLATVRIETTFGEPDFSRSVDSPIGYSRISPYMKGAVYNGLFQPLSNPINDTLPFCNTGNCTFDPYQTLSVCWGLKNVSSSLHVVDVDPLFPDYPFWKKVCLSDTGYCLNISTSDPDTRPGAIVGSAAGPYPDYFNTTSSLKSLDVNATTEALNFTSIAFPKHKNPIADVYMIYKDPDAYEDGRGEFAAVAREFMLDWCAVWLETKVINGVAKTTYINRTTPLFTFDDSDTIFGGMVAEVNGTEFGCDNTTHNSLQRYLQRVFNGTIYYDDYGYVPDSDVLGVLMDSVGLEPGDVLLKNPNNLDPLELTIANLASTMGDYVRIYNPMEAKVANGTAFTQRVIVRVSWGWLVAPILFSAASLIFFLLVVSLRLRRHGHLVRPTVWKSSNMAMMRSLDTDLQAALGGMVGKSAMDAAAEDVRVRLEWTGASWRLVTQPSGPSVAEKYNQHGASVSS